MREAGCNVVFYHPFSLRSVGRLNKRDHRKLAIVDSRRAYVFGHGFGEEWDHDTRGDRAWRDTAARVEGPAVNALQAVFAQNWMGETGEVLTGSPLLPAAPRRRATSRCRWWRARRAAASPALRSSIA